MLSCRGFLKSVRRVGDSLLIGEAKIAQKSMRVKIFCPICLCVPLLFIVFHAACATPCVAGVFSFCSGAADGGRLQEPEEVVGAFVVGIRRGERPSGSIDDDIEGLCVGPKLMALQEAPLGMTFVMPCG